jgi:hypothetical protein
MDVPGGPHLEFRFTASTAGRPPSMRNDDPNRMETFIDARCPSRPRTRRSTCAAAAASA